MSELPGQVDAEQLRELAEQSQADAAEDSGFVHLG